MRDRGVGKSIAICIIGGLIIIAVASLATMYDPPELSKENVKDSSIVSEDAVYFEDTTTGYSNTKYVVTFKIKQFHYSLDLGEHARDELNAVEIQIPVDKEYYDSLEIGDVINNDFRIGSLILHGSFNTWKITVVDKQEMEAR